MRLTETRIRQVIRMTLLEADGQGPLDLNRFMTKMLELSQKFVYAAAETLSDPVAGGNDPDESRRILEDELISLSLPELDAISAMCTVIVKALKRKMGLPLDVDREKLVHWIVADFVEAAVETYFGDYDSDNYFEYVAARASIDLLSTCVSLVRDDLRRELGTKYRSALRGGDPDDIQRVEQEIAAEIDSFCGSFKFKSQNYVEDLRRDLRQAVFEHY